MPRHHRHLLLTATMVGALASSPLPGRAGPQAASSGALNASFDTREKAEAAARQFHCQGAHRMGDKWMPCASHEETGGRHRGGTTAPTGSSAP